MSMEKTKLDEIYNSLPEYFKNKIDQPWCQGEANADRREQHILTAAVATELSEVCKKPKEIMEFWKLDTKTKEKMLPKTGAFYPRCCGFAATQALLYRKSQGNQFVRNLMVRLRGYDKLY